MKTNGAPPSSREGKRSAAAPPDPEVSAKATRRRFTAAYKLSIIEQAKPSGGKREARKVRKFERENVRLREELRKAHIVIEVQGKASGLLALSLGDGKSS